MATNKKSLAWGLLWALVPASILGLLVSCSNPGTRTVPTPTFAPSTAQAGFQAIPVATSDLTPGQNRVSFALLGPDGTLVSNAQVRMRFYRISGGEAELTGEVAATYREVSIPIPHVHADGQVHQHLEARGVYVVERVSLDVPGPWGMQLAVLAPPRTEMLTINLLLQVKGKGSTPALGALAPASRNKTARDVADLSEISSSTPPNPKLYQMSVAEGLAAKRPMVVAFASPAYCTSRICGPALDEVTSLEPTYGQKIAFLHIEPYDLQLLRSKGEFMLTSAAQDWGLPSEPWAFVVDSQGKVIAKFEGVFTAEELKEVLDSLS